jgi:hypothetical protein
VGFRPVAANERRAALGALRVPSPAKIAGSRWRVVLFGAYLLEIDWIRVRFATALGADKLTIALGKLDGSAITRLVVFVGANVAKLGIHEAPIFRYPLRTVKSLNHDPIRQVYKPSRLVSLTV